MSEEVKLQGLYFQVNFLSDPKMLALRYRHGPLGVLAYISILLQLAKEASSTIDEDAALAELGIVRIPDPRAVLDYYLDSGLFEAGEAPETITHAGVQRQQRLLVQSKRKKLRLAVFERDGGLCRMCGVDQSESEWHADHVVPLCEGGIDSLDNLRTLCVPCHKVVTKELSARRRRP
jgi:hypothetical protein